MPLIQPIVTASGGSNFVPQTRILTINGVSYDLSADRTWTVEVLDNLIATAPLSYNSGTNTISISQSGASADGYLSSADWLTFSAKQPAITLTTTGNSGASTLVGATLNIPEYTLAGLGGFSNPMTSLGDIIYGNAVGLALRRAGNTTTTKMFLSQTGDGSVSAAPTWATAVTSVALTMPSAFSVTGSPITTTGTLAVTAIGTATQYIRGDGQLATFPSNAGGGSSVNYYLNGSVTASVFGYKQMDNNAVIGAGTDFNLTGNGLIAAFLTDAGNPNRIQIPSGAWNFEMYFNSSSNGGNEKFFVELHKWDGVAFTLIASSSTNPEAITGGTATDLYLTSLAVPTTALLVTDRLAVRVYIVDNSAGRTITLHTENGNLCEIITTFAGGVASLNGLTANTQYLAVGTSGSDFNISSVTDTHTFNLPSASASVRGALLSADWSTFNGKMNNVFTSLGDMVYSNAGGLAVRRSGNITTTKMFLSQTGDGTTSAAPQWSTVTAADTGSVPTSRTITINGTSFDLSANRTYSVGTVTSVALSVPTGLTITGSPITTSGTLAVTFTAGYSIPTTAKQTEWDTAFTNRITSLTTTGSSGAATLISNTLNIPTYTAAGLGAVPTSRTLTINDVAFDLSADRSYSIGDFGTW